MELFLLLIVAMVFFFLFRVYRDKNGAIKIQPRYQQSSQNNGNFKKQLLEILQSKMFISFVTIGFVFIEIIIFSRLMSPVETLIKVRASQLLPQKFTPIARFAANMDWESKTVQLDASMSKAYQDTITNYIWRIDDGTSLVGSKSLEHTFTNPGYYYIQLSIVDADNQSDVATCQILIPPEELEQVATHERLTETKQTSETVKDVDYEWAPKGTFFNYSKMASNERSYANLKSRYIESGCGYSNKTYNTYSHSYVDFLHDQRVQRALASMLRTLMIGVVLIPVLYGITVRFLKRKWE